MCVCERGTIPSHTPTESVILKGRQRTSLQIYSEVRHIAFKSGLLSGKYGQGCSLTVLCKIKPLCRTQVYQCTFYYECAFIYTLLCNYEQDDSQSMVDSQFNQFQIIYWELTYVQGGSINHCTQNICYFLLLPKLGCARYEFLQVIFFSICIMDFGILIEIYLRGQAEVDLLTLGRHQLQYH